MTPASSNDHRDAVIRALLDDGKFLRATLTGRKRAAGNVNPVTKIIMRPVRVRDTPKIQISYLDGKRDIAKNYSYSDIEEPLDEVLAMSFAYVHVQTTDYDLHIRTTKKGRSSMTRSKPSCGDRSVPSSHNRVKNSPLPSDRPDSFLQAVGIMGTSGSVHASKYDKYRQINQFLLVMRQVVVPLFGGQALRIVDCGCGNAYLTFAAYHFLNHIEKVESRVTGVDREGERIQQCEQLQQQLGWDGMAFEHCDIGAYRPDHVPDVVVSLHACDTATDEAIARGVQWGSRVILCVPCCQHELHDKLSSEDFSAVLQHGILKQRLADIVTDGLRAAVLKIMGYRTRVIEFVDPEASTKNLMIRAEKTGKPGSASAVTQYLALKSFWGAQPAIEVLLADELREYLGD